MYRRLSIQKGLLLISFLITGIFAGIVFVTPKVSGDQFLGGLVGFTISLVLSCFLFSELRNMFSDNWSGDNMFGIRMKALFTHPTQKPLMLGMLWFVCFALLLGSGLLNLIIEKLSIQQKPDLILMLLSPTLFLWGVSGVLMIKQKEGVNKFGQIYGGSWAYFNGILAIIIFWGALLIMILATIFDW